MGFDTSPPSPLSILKGMERGSEDVVPSQRLGNDSLQSVGQRDFRLPPQAFPGLADVGQAAIRVVIAFAVKLRAGDLNRGMTQILRSPRNPGEGLPQPAR